MLSGAYHVLYLSNYAQIHPYRSFHKIDKSELHTLLIKCNDSNTENKSFFTEKSDIREASLCFFFAYRKATR